jgi:hypothetical protein
VFVAFSFRTETGNWAVFQDDLVEVKVPPPLVRAPPSVDIPRLLHRTREAGAVTLT